MAAFIMVTVVRSMPSAASTDGRAHVVDHLRSIRVDDYDFSELGTIAEADGEGVVHLEFDVVMPPEDLVSFVKSCRGVPHPLTVPYRLYPPYVGKGVVRPVWAHRMVDDDGQAWYIRDGEPFCDYFGLGCVYLPTMFLRDFGRTESPALKMNDETLSRFSVRWHGRRATSVLWQYQAVHLHSPVYDLIDLTDTTPEDG